MLFPPFRYVVIANILNLDLYITGASNINYEALFSGVADIGGTRFPGDLYWRAPDGESRAYAFYGVKYGNSKRFETSWFNNEFSYLSLPNRNKFGPQCMQQSGQNTLLVTPSAFGQQKGHAVAGHHGGQHKLFSGEISHSDMSEDCLYLDVYVPAIHREQKSTEAQGKPVMLFVHGGSSGNKLPGIGIEFSRIHGIVFVSVQYRLGLFGFLSTEDANSPGNYGLGDVKLAVKWVRQYIFAFGGNMEKITLVGHGSGGVLVSAMMLDPDIRNIVLGVICMSGSVLSPLALSRSPRANAAAVANALRCPTTSVTEMVLCFKIASATDIAVAIAAAFPGTSGQFPGEEKFALSIDGHHIPYKPEWVLQSQPWHFRGGFLNGFLSEDASLLLLTQWPEIYSQGYPTLDQAKSVYIPHLLRSVGGCFPPPMSVVEAVYNRYAIGASADPKSLRKCLVTLANDIYWRIPAVKESLIYSEKNLTQLGNQMYTISFDNHIGQQAFGLNDLGVFHGLDIQYLFSALGTPNLLGNKTSEKVTRQLRLLWTYVATYGKAFGDQFNPTRGNILQLGQDEVWTKTADHKLRELVLFWDKVAAVSCTNPQGIHITPAKSDPFIPTFNAAQRRTGIPALHPLSTNWPNYATGPFPVYMTPTVVRKKKKREYTALRRKKQ